MKTAEDIRIERWEDQDFVITGLHYHGGVFSKTESEMILRFVRDALPLIQRDAMLHVLNHMLQLVRGRRILNRPDAYVAAVDDMEIFLMAAIERVENNEPVNSTAIVQ